MTTHHEVWWHTDAITADESDFENLSGMHQRQRDYRRMYRTIRTTDEHYPELDETSRVRATNPDSEFGNTQCDVTMSKGKELAITRVRSS